MAGARKSRYIVLSKGKPSAPTALVCPEYTVPNSAYAAYGKRALDLILVLLALPIIITLVLVLGLLVWLDGGNPLYSQQRVGRGGACFRMWKLRSMHLDADDVLAKLLANDAKICGEWNTYKKLRSDPRVTRIGRLMRKVHVDEIPQFWNVLLGNMSLVGPRPIMLWEKTTSYPKGSYYALRPGVTGNWQVLKNKETLVTDRADFDRRYIESISLRNDLAIILKTIPAVLGGVGR